MNRVHIVEIPQSWSKQVPEISDRIRLHRSLEENRFFVSDYSLDELKKCHVPFRKIQTCERNNVPVNLVFPFQSVLFDPPQPDALDEAIAFAMTKQRGKQHPNLIYLGRSQKTPSGSFCLDRPGGVRHYHWKISHEVVDEVDLRNRFPNVIKTIKDPETRVVLSFGAGGLRLFAHTALMKFVELLGLRAYVDEVWGCSGGSIAGLLYSLGVEAAKIEKEGYNVYNNRYSLRLSPNRLDVLKNLALDFVHLGSKRQLTGFLDCHALLQSLLKKYLSNPMDIPFYCLAYNVTKRRNEVLTPELVPTGTYDVPIIQTDAVDAVAASSAIPMVYVPKKIVRGQTKHTYIDGGASEELPLLSPFLKWREDRKQKRERRPKLLIIAVNLFSGMSARQFVGRKWLKYFPAVRMLEFTTNFADFIRQAHIDEHKNILERNEDVMLWETRLPVKGASSLNPKMIPKIIETAHRSFLNQLIKTETALAPPKEKQTKRAA